MNIPIKFTIIPVVVVPIKVRRRRAAFNRLQLPKVGLRLKHEQRT